MLTNKDMNDLLANHAANKSKLSQAEVRAWLIRVLQDETMPCTLNLDCQAYIVNACAMFDMGDLMNGKL